MKLCDRCYVPGCCLNYLGTACKAARKEHCPDVRPNRAELLCNCESDEMAAILAAMTKEFCATLNHAPSAEDIADWLIEEPSE